MHGFEVLVLAPIAAALGAGVWAIARRKWYGLAPALLLGLAATFAGPTVNHHLAHGLEYLVNSPGEHLTMTWLLASAAALLSWTAIWAVPELSTQQGSCLSKETLAVLH